MRWPAVMLPLLVACSERAPDITGPFTGPTTRFVVDRFTLPISSNDVKLTADDLDGNGTEDDQLASAITTLELYHDTTSHASDMIASGAVLSSLELQAPSLDDADKAGATYFGADGAPADVMGGDIANGVFTSNRTRTTRVPGRAIFHLPVFADADPSVFELEAMEADLTPDGNGGYDAVLRGGIAPDQLAAAVGLGISQMVANDPIDHMWIGRQCDANHDGIVTADEVTSWFLVAELIAPDVTLDGQKMTSFAIAVHLVPCDSGSCAPGPTDTCHDRVRDGDETDVDCGGSCASCGTGAACAQGWDCLSRSCDAGACRAPSCTDGVRDGLEGGIDCGWLCFSCGAGAVCTSDADCPAGWMCLPTSGWNQLTCQ